MSIKIIVITICVLIVVFFVVDDEFDRLNHVIEDNKNILQACVTSTAKHFDYYKSAEGIIEFESNTYDIFREFLKLNLNLDNTLIPINGDDIKGQVIIDNYYIATTGYDSVIGKVLNNPSIVVTVKIPYNFNVLGISIDFYKTYNLYAPLIDLR